MEATKDLTEEEITKKIQELNKPKPSLKKKEELPSLFEDNKQRFDYFCKDLPSPDIFIKFDFYFMISACLARKVWIGKGHGRVYPNIYLVAVSDPGIGKSVPAGIVNSLLNSLVESKMLGGKLQELSLLNLGPDAITYEKLVLRAAQSTDVIKDAKGKNYHHSSTTFCLVEEMNLLFSDNTRKVVAFLLQCYNCGDFKGDTIKHKEQVIKNVCINFLGCTTPDIMKDFLRTRILDSGFLGRTLFIYGDKKRPHPPLIEISPQQESEYKYIAKHLRKLALLKPQEIELTNEARAWLEDWHYNKQDIFSNPHPRLKDYYARRKIHMVKLAINDAYANSLEPILRVENLINAEKDLLSCEFNMHKALASTSENPLADIAEKIKNYISTNGPSTRRKLMLAFFHDADELQLGRVFQYLIDTGQCVAVEINNKEGLKMK